MVKTPLLFGTVVCISAHGAGEESVQQALEEMERIESLMSPYRQESEVSSINRAGGEVTPISPETAEVIAVGLELASMTGGAFDPTIRPLVHLWGFDSGSPRLPESEEIVEVLKLVDYTAVILREDGVTLDPGMSVDLNALTKGYAADRAVEMLAESGAEGVLVNAGQSSMKVLGTAPGGRPWKIGLMHPRRENEIYAAIEMQKMQSLSTTGDYQNYFVADGERYSHVFNPATGWPAQSMQAITVLAESAMWADGLSTALFVMEPGEALTLVEKMPGVEAVVVTAEGDIMYSGGLRGKIELLDGKEAGG
ncbi:MAG: FAD:protein FMN transferase [Bacillota bacterium]